LHAQLLRRCDLDKPQRRQLEEEVIAGVGRLVAIADAAAERAADVELEAAAAARRATWVQAVNALTAQKAAAQVRRSRTAPEEPWNVMRLLCVCWLVEAWAV
jgi:hypothetical protein